MLSSILSDNKKSKFKYEKNNSMTNETKSQTLFRWAIGYLFHQNEVKLEIIPFGFSRVVNFAFACELLIKSHLIRENNIKGGHYLKDLFEDLSTDKQTCIRDYIKRVYPNTIYENEPFNFDQIIDEQSKVFVEWRYPFDINFNQPLENTRGHYGFLYQFAKALIEKYKDDYKEFPTYNNYNPDFDSVLPNANYTLH